MYEKEAEETVDKSNWLFPQSKELAKDFWQKGAEFGYNKAKEEAREILAKLLEEERNNMYWEMNGSDKSSYYKVIKQAEQFLKE